VEEDIIQDAKELLGVVRRMRSDLTRVINEVLSGTGVSLAQFSVLSMLSEMSEANMSSLAAGLGTTMGAVTNLVDKLLYAGHVARERSVDDRRVVNVSITPQGRQVVEHHCGLGTNFLAGFFDGTTPEERRTIIETHRKLSDFLHQTSSGTANTSESDG